jgi:hypothetical protein
MSNILYLNNKSRKGAIKARVAAEKMANKTLKRIFRRVLPL